MKDKRKTKIIALANQKGGVAKTTSAINIAVGLSLNDKSVLLIDLDSQANLSSWLNYTPDNRPLISDLIYNEVNNNQVNYEDYIRSNNNKQYSVDYIPSDRMLSGVISIINQSTQKISIIKQILQNEFFSKYDYIIIDCSPSLDLLATNAIFASDKLLIPIQTEMWAYEGTNQILKTLLQIKPSTDLTKSVLMLPTFYKEKTLVSRAIYDALKSSYGDIVLSPIPCSQAVINSTTTKTALVTTANTNKKNIVGKAYLKIATKIAKEIN